MFAVVGVGLVGCAAESLCEGERCDVAVIAASTEPDVLLPPITMQSVARTITDLLFLKLADIGPSLNTVGDDAFEPRLARSWSFEDSVTIAFELHPSARWHDGNPVTSQDVVFTYDLYTDSLVASPIASMLARIDSVTARDESTVVFHFADAYSEQFYDATYRMRILPSHILGSSDRSEIHSSEFGSSPVGSGPYRFSRWERGELLELLADSTFFLGGPEIKRLVWRFARDEAGLVNMLLAGEADITEAIVNPENVDRIAASDHLDLVPYPAPVYGYIGFNLKQPQDAEIAHELFADRDLRRALVMAVDRQAIVDAALGGRGVVPVGPTGRAVWIWSEDVEQIPFDAAGARAELERLGWVDSDGDGVLDRDGIDLAFDLMVPSSSGVRRRSAVIVQEQLRSVGVAVTIEELEFNAFMERATSGRFEALFGAFGLDLSPSGIAQLWTTSGIGEGNWQRYSSEEFDQHVAAAIDARERSEAARHWRIALETINADAPSIWIFEPSLSAVVHSRFSNVTVRADQWAADLWRWSAPNR